MLADEEWEEEQDDIEDTANKTMTYEEFAEKATEILSKAKDEIRETKEIMSVSEDKKTSFVTLSVQHKSPVIAQQWVEIMMDQIDQVMRDQDRQTARKSIEYLNSLAPTINYEEIKQTLASLQQEQMKRLMMVEANENYIFKVLDSPIVPEMKVKPQRSLIVILGTMLGMMLSVLVFWCYITQDNLPSMMSLVFDKGYYRLLELKKKVQC